MAETKIEDYNISNTVMPPGTIIQHISLAPFPGWLLCNGQAVSRTLYAKLFAMMPVYSSVFTFSGSTITWNGHPMLTGSTCSFSSTGTLPTGILANTTYFARYISSNTFSIHPTIVDAFANINIISLSGGSLIHTVTSYPFGNGDSNTTFNVPNFSGVVPRGVGTPPSSFYSTNPTIRMGERLDDQMQGHIHSEIYGNFASYSGVLGGIVVTRDSPVAGGPTLLSGASTGNPSTGSHGNVRIGNETRVKSIGINFFIKV